MPLSFIAFVNVDGQQCHKILMHQIIHELLHCAQVKDEVGRVNDRHGYIDAWGERLPLTIDTQRPIQLAGICGNEANPADGELVRSTGLPTTAMQRTKY